MASIFPCTSYSRVRRRSAAVGDNERRNRCSAGERDFGEASQPLVRERHFRVGARGHDAFDWNRRYYLERVMDAPALSRRALSGDLYHAPWPRRDCEAETVQLHNRSHQTEAKA